MSSFVVDASVAAKWLFEEAHTEEALRLLDGRNRLHAPDFLLIEVDNIICKRIRRGKIGEDGGREARAGLRRFPVQHHASQGLLDPAYEIANRTRRSLYDCLYLALAVMLDMRMVTADRRLYDGLADGPFAKHVMWVENVGLDENGGREDER